jgi:pimeloyl-ACP methyl ester carboxylesterase
MQTLGRSGKGLAVPATSFLLLFLAVPLALATAPPAPRPRETHPTQSVQETGFLNRTIEVQGIPYRFQVYVPEDFHRTEQTHAADKNSDKKGDKPSGKDSESSPPIILFLHGRGERGSEGMWQTQVGLPQQLRDHPERWPFIVVMPQCPFRHFWTDPEMLQMAMASLDQEAREFHADPERTYLAGLSLGGYGAWELARNFPHRWAAIAIVASGVFWSYAPERWREVSTLPAEYARRLGRTPVWLFHGAEDTTVIPRQSELMFEALKAENGHVRLWDYQGLHHDSWTRAFNEPELPRWLLSHRLSQVSQLPPLAERITIPLHPPALKLPTTILDTYVGEYRDTYNVLVATIQRQGEQVFLRNAQGDVNEIMAESTSTFFYPTGSLTRLTFEHDAQGRVTGILYRDDRHEELWEKRK